MAKYYEEPARKVPIVEETEVLVVGGGPAGFGAALTAARMGRKVLLVEQAGAVGGIATTGIMSHWTGFRAADALRSFWKGRATVRRLW